MYYNQSWAAKGRHGDRRQHILNLRSAQRAFVNVYKTGTTYEMLVFAPGRIREHFKIDVKGNELIISYTPPEGFPKQEWVRKEYSRGGFERTFTLDETIDTSNISAKYVDGVLHVILPLIPGKETTSREIKIN
jgi:HSP20 family protein